MAALMFKDLFWGSDFTCHSGYDAVIQRLRDGRQMCKDVEELFKMRALAEEKYGKELVTIAHKTGGHTEISTLRASYEELKTQLETIGNFHIHLSDKLKEEVKKLETFRERQKEQRRKFESIMEKIQKKKVSLFKKTMESKKNYKMKCKEADEAEQGLEKANGAARNSDKLHQRIRQSRQGAREAEKLYMNNVSQLEDVRQDWEETHRSTLEVFQQLEGDRIGTLRCALWDHCNYFSMQCVRDDELYEEVRKVLEQCDIIKDNNNFIKVKSTGSRPAAPILFESCYETERSQSANGQTLFTSQDNIAAMGNNLNKKRMSLMETHRCIEPLTWTSVLINNDSLRNPGPALPSVGDYESIENSSAALLDPHHVSDAASAEPEYYSVLYEYTAQEEDEMTVSRGDIVRLLDQSQDGWWTVERNGLTGLVPGNYLEKIAATGSALA